MWKSCPRVCTYQKSKAVRHCGLYIISNFLRGRDRRQRGTRSPQLKANLGHTERTSVFKTEEYFTLNTKNKEGLKVDNGHVCHKLDFKANSNFNSVVEVCV